MKNALKIIGIILFLLLIGGAGVYLGLIKLPASYAKLPVIGSLMPQTEVEEKNVTISKELYDKDISRLEKQLVEAKKTNAEITKANKQLEQELKVAKQDQTAGQSANDGTAGGATSSVDKYKKLAEYYGNMKKVKAAAIMAELDDDTVINILQKMGSDTAAGILTEMPPQRAAVLTKKMTQ
ncbi:MAG: MotE family protein [Ignavibacteriales bacterium]